MRPHPTSSRRCSIVSRCGDRAGGIFLKVGFAGVGRLEQAAEILRLAVHRARALGPSVAVIAASYADCDRARAPSPEADPRCRHRCRRRRSLDRYLGQGWSGTPAAALGRRAGCLGYSSPGAGLLAALAGGLAADEVPSCGRLQPDVVGVRGAVCRGGRAGALDPGLLRRLRAAALDRFGPSGDRTGVRWRIARAGGSPRTAPPVMTQSLTGMRVAPMREWRPRSRSRGSDPELVPGRFLDPPAPAAEEQIRSPPARTLRRLRGHSDRAGRLDFLSPRHPPPPNSEQ